MQVRDEVHFVERVAGCSCADDALVLTSRTGTIRVVHRVGCRFHGQWS